MSTSVMTDSGLAIITNLVSGLGGTVPKYIAWGMGAGVAAVGNTTLFTEAAEARTSGTVTRVTTNKTNDTLQVVGTITSLSGQTITNVGLFDALTTGNIFTKSDFTGATYTLATGEGIQFTLRVVYS